MNSTTNNNLTIDIFVQFEFSIHDLLRFGKNWLFRIWSFFFETFVDIFERSPDSWLRRMKWWLRRLQFHRDSNGNLIVFKSWYWIYLVVCLTIIGRFSFRSIPSYFFSYAVCFFSRSSVALIFRARSARKCEKDIRMSRSGGALC